jgi:hypothetical protein
MFFFVKKGAIEDLKGWGCFRQNVADIKKVVPLH